MFKRILVAIDGSTASNAGLQWAVDLARDQQATLVALNVVDDAVLPINFEGAVYPASYVDTVMASIEKAGQKVLDRAVAVARNRGVEIQPKLVRSRGNAVADVIVAQARKIKPDVIVLGTHGRRGLRRIIMGSDAEQVLRQATVPVALVRGTYRKTGKARASQPRPAAPKVKTAARPQAAAPAS